MRAGIRWGAVVSACLALAGCRGGSGVETGPYEPYLVVWAGDADRKDNDFLAIVNASPSSWSYGKVVATLPVRSRASRRI